MPKTATPIPEWTERDLVRFWEKVNKDGPVQPHMTTPCWLWTDVPMNGGYGSFWLKPRKVLAHRFAYTLAHDEEPKLFVDHICRVRSCVRHDHLRQATNQENTLNRTKPTLGVYWHQARRKWHAQVAIPGGTKYLGLYDDRDEALRVASAARESR